MSGRDGQRERDGCSFLRYHRRRAVASLDAPTFRVAFRPSGRRPAVMYRRIEAVDGIFQISGPIAGIRGKDRIFVPSSAGI